MTTHFFNVGTAMKVWRETRENPERDWDAFEATEAFILTGVPKTRDDALAVLDVVISQNGDSRSDGLDHRGLRGVRSYLASLKEKG